MEYKGYRFVELDDEELAAHYLNEDKEQYLENEYLVITQNGKIVDKRVYQKGETRSLRAFEIGDSYTEIWKPKNIEQSLAFDLVEDEKVPVKLLTGRYGSGKAQPKSTLIPTPKGWRKLGDIKVGDEVYDRSGAPTKVLKVFPQGKKDNYKISFSDGRFTYCNDEHIWGCLTNRGNLIVPFTVKEMLKKGIKKENGEYTFKIPVCQPVQYEEKKFDIDPYVVGVIFGGDCRLLEEDTISCRDEELIEQISKALRCGYLQNAIGWNLTFGNGEKDLYGRPRIVPHTVNTFPFSELDKMAEAKKIPKDYLMGSVEQRFAFLQGLFDSAGIIEQSKGQIAFYSFNLQLIKDIQKLCYSLGLLPEVTEKKKDGKTYSRIGVSVSIIEKEKMLRVKSKKELTHILQDSSFNKTISVTEIKKMDEKVEMVCILVDNDEHLYLTNDYLVTHNTGILCKAGVSAVRKGKFNKLMWIRNNIEVKDTNPLGSLPGDLLQKMWWTAGPLIDHCGGEEGLLRLIEDGSIEVAYLGHLRGRDIRNSLIICSEAENLTKQHIQLLLGRVGEGSHLWLDADLRQRDKMIFEKTAGIENMVEKLKDNPLFGYIHLEKTERSETACLADLLDG